MKYFSILGKNARERQPVVQINGSSHSVDDRSKITKRDMEGKREERDKVKTGKQKRARRSGAINSFI